MKLLSNDILTESKQGGPKTWNHKLARYKVCVLQEDLLHQLPTWWFQTVLQELCFTHYPQQTITAYGIYLLTLYIWMNYTFISIFFQNFLCQSYRRKKTGIFTFVPKHWVAADHLDRCKNPWCSIPKHMHFPDSLSLTLVYAMCHCWQRTCCTYTVSTSARNTHNSQMPHADVLSQFTTLLKCLLVSQRVLTQFPPHSKIIS